MSHKCSFYDRQQLFPEAEDGYGPAILECMENEKGEFWVGNGEYANQVNFCPFDGIPAPVKFDFDSLPKDLSLSK